MPVFERNSLVQAAEYISKELGERYQVDDVESLIEEGELFACVDNGLKLKYLLPGQHGGYDAIKNGRSLVVVDTREEVALNPGTNLEHIPANEFQLRNIVILKKELDAFLASRGCGGPMGLGRVSTPKPVGRLRTMQMAILEAIAQLGLDPLALPAKKRGAPGVRKAVRAHLEKNSELYVTDSTFRKAYQGLRDSGEIQTA